ncbi:putative RNA methylase [Peribacillus simplex]|nr:putative RNA methylase [Peribacillus simplex]
MRGMNFAEVQVADLCSGFGVLGSTLYNEGATVISVEPSKKN